MRIERTAPKQGIPLGAIFGGVLVLGAGLAFVWLRLGLPLPVCHFREWTGLPCPTCGATRMVQALLDLEIGRAVILNPVLFLLLAVVVVWAVASIGVRVLGLPAWRIEFEPRERLLVRVAVVLVFLSDWAYLIWRGT